MDYSDWLEEDCKYIKKYYPAVKKKLDHKQMVKGKNKIET